MINIPIHGKVSVSAYPYTILAIEVTTCCINYLGGKTTTLMNPKEKPDV